MTVRQRREARRSVYEAPVTVGDLSREPDDPRAAARWEQEVRRARLGLDVWDFSRAFGGTAWTTCVVCDAPAAVAEDGRGRSRCCDGPLRVQGWA